MLFEVILIILCPIIIFIIKDIVHEVGHLIVLKYVYKIDDAGIGFGNIVYRQKGFLKIGSTKIYFYRIFPISLKGSVAFVFPWREVHEGNKRRRILFYSSGYLSEMLLSLILLLIFLNTNNLSFMTYVMFLFAIIIPGISPLAHLLSGLWTGKTYLSNSASNLLKVKYGYSDGSGVLLNSKPIFVITFIISFCYAAFLYKTLLI